MPCGPVTKPQNIFVPEDVQCVGYVAGSNTRFFGWLESTDRDDEPYT